MQQKFETILINKESELYVNPFLEKAEMEDYIILRKDIEKLKERNDNLKQFKFEKLFDYINVQEFIKKSIDKNRIPMIISSQQLGLTKNEFITKLKEKTLKNIFEFNLRDILIEKKTKGSCKDYLNKTKEALSNVITKGETFLINLDETEKPYEEIYDPDLREFYSATEFPSQIWDVNYLKRPEVYEKILIGTANKPTSKISTNFSIVVWSKFRIDQSFDNQKIMEKFERRFSSIIPTQKIDLILMCQEEKKVEVEAPSPPKRNVASKKKKKK